MKKEISNSSTVSDKSPKFVFTEYRDMNKMKKIPVNNVYLENLAKQLIDWANNNDSIIRFSQFYRLIGIRPTEFVRLREHSSILQEAYDYVNMLIAENREVGAATNKFNFAVINATQSHYCHISKEQQEFRADLSAKAKGNEGGNSTITVLMDQFPATNRVPEKKE